METWNAVIDVSNVCWSPYLPPEDRHRPRLRRLHLVMTAWRELHGDDVQFRLVADDSLWRAFDADDLREFRRLIHDGELVTRAVADPLILELARDENLHVISRDHYIDHRAAHPWIEISPDRFHCWRLVGDQVVIEPLGIVAHSAQTVSVAIEIKDLKRVTRLDSKNARHRKILGTRWRCPNVRCSEASQWQDQLLTWPAVTAEGTALCPSCASTLTGLGPRDPLYEVVAADRASGGEIMRFPLEAGIPLIIGRGAGLKGVDLSARQTPFRDAVMHVSRRHLLLRIEHVNTSRRIVAVDLGSRNGTQIERWEQKEFLAAKAIAADKDVYLGSKDRLVLGDAVNLRLSGKHYMPAGGVAEPTSLEVPYWSGTDDPAGVDDLGSGADGGGRTVIMKQIHGATPPDGRPAGGTPPDGRPPDGVPRPPQSYLLKYQYSGRNVPSGLNVTPLRSLLTACTW
jgi:FHA domain